MDGVAGNFEFGALFSEVAAASLGLPTELEESGDKKGEDESDASDG